MCTRVPCLAPVRAINPEVLKAIFAFLQEMLPIILQLFIPKPTSAKIPPRGETLHAFCMDLEAKAEVNNFSDEETSQLCEAMSSFCDLYIARTRPKREAS